MVSLILCIDVGAVLLLQQINWARVIASGQIGTLPEQIYFKTLGEPMMYGTEGCHTNSVQLNQSISHQVKGVDVVSTP